MIKPELLRNGIAILLIHVCVATVIFIMIYGISIPIGVFLILDSVTVGTMCGIGIVEGL